MAFAHNGADFPLHFLDRLVNLCDIVGIASFIMANYWFFTTKTCRDSDPALYYVSLLWIIVGYIILSAPVLLCVTFIFCFPVILVIIRVFNLGPL